MRRDRKKLEQHSLLKRWLARSVAVVLGLVLVAAALWFIARRVPSAYVRYALFLMQRHSIMREKVDWPALKAEALASTRSAKTVADTYPVIRTALGRLGDNHSHLIPASRVRAHREGRLQGSGLLVLYPERVAVRVYPRSPAERAGLRVGDIVETMNDAEPGPAEPSGAFMFVRDGTVHYTLRRAHQVGPIRVALTSTTFDGSVPPSGKRLDGDIGFLELPATAGAGPYARLALEAVRRVDEPPVCGWVVDLRRNQGGNMWPMLAGVRPILGEGRLGSFVAGDRRSYWSYPNQRISGLDGSGYHLKRPMPPVAVLTSRLTASAGEAVAIAFRGRPNTRSFGEPTGGLPTANQTFHLPDGAMLALTTAFEADRTGRIYTGRIPPDEPVAEDWVRIESDDDPVALSAAQWLSGQAACKATDPRGPGER